MRIPNVQIKDTILAKFMGSTPDEMQSGILVPVNSSTNAFNSLEYALKLAKILNKTIHLFYVMDINIDDLSESTIVAHRILGRTYRNAETCVESLKEMIEECGVRVVTAESKIGSIGSLILQQAEYIRPGMIVIGRDCFTRNVIGDLIVQSACPVIVIPESASPQLPSSIVLTKERNRFAEKSLDPLIRIVQGTTQELTILSFAKFKKTMAERIAVPHCINNLMVHYRQIDYPPSALTVNDFVRTNGVGLACIIHQKQSFFRRLLRRSFSSEIVFRLEIPVMIVPEADA